MKKPLIALFPYHDTKSSDLFMRASYQRAVTCFGGIPVILPLEPTTEDYPRLAEAFDGFIFTGGPDIHPFYFGEETKKGCGSSSELRDYLELTLFHEILKTHKPILGICRGLQLLNIALGGNIYQDLNSQLSTPSDIAHNQPLAYNLPSHRVHIDPSSHLYKVMGVREAAVNSMHHQAVKDLAPGLSVCAYSSDGLIEAVEMPKHKFFIGVQWHPEQLYLKDPSAGRLFQSLIQAAQTDC